MRRANPYILEDFLYNVQEGWDIRIENPEQKQLVVLCHGWISNPKRMTYLAHYFMGKGFSVFRLSLSVTFGSVSKLLKEITNQVQMVNFNDYKQVHFIGHSFGGILTKNLLNDHKIPNAKTFVSLGTPWGGTDFGDKVRDVVTRKEDPTLFGNGLVLLERAKKNKMKNKIKVGLVAGDKPYKEEKPGKELPPHDGTVTVESAFALKESVVSKRVYNLNHAELRMNSKVADSLLKFSKGGKL